MSMYVVAADLTYLNGHYDALISYLTALGAEPKLRTVWTLEANGLSTDALERDLSRLVHPQDKFFVAKLGN